MDLNDTAAFVAVARLESFTRAAERLGVPKGTVSRQVARLEERLGARLLQRTTRSVSLTDVGRAYYERCGHAVDALADAERLVADVSGRATGTLRIAAPFDFARDHLCSWLPELHRQHPALHVHLELSQRRVDLVADDIDVALRAGGSMDDSGLVARKLFTSALVFAASPAYLRKHGRPRTLRDLSDHECLCIHRRGAGTRWPLVGPDGPAIVELRGWLSANEFGVLHAAVRGGTGIGLCEGLGIRKDLASARLERVLPDYSVEGGGLWAVYPSAHHLSPKVRVFVDFIAAKLRNVTPAS